MHPLPGLLREAIGVTRAPVRRRRHASPASHWPVNRSTTLDLTASPLGTFFQSAGSCSPSRSRPSRSGLRLGELADQGLPDQGLPDQAFTGPADLRLRQDHPGRRNLRPGHRHGCVANLTLGDVADKLLDVDLSKLIALVAGDAALHECLRPLRLVRPARRAHPARFRAVGTGRPRPSPASRTPRPPSSTRSSTTPTSRSPTVAATATLQVVLPEGFAYVPGGSTLNGQPLGNPVLSVSSGTDGCGAGAGRTILTYTLPTCPPGSVMSRSMCGPA